MMGIINDDSVFADFEEGEQRNPFPRKELEDRVIYSYRELRPPMHYRAPVLCDFGSAVPEDQEHLEDIQPRVYRAPEVILEAPCDYKVWAMFEGYNLFTGLDPEHETYRSRAHLAQMMAVFGPPPQSLLDQASLRRKFFSDKGEFSAGVQVPDAIPLRQLENRLEGESKGRFLRLMGKMMQWDAAKKVIGCRTN